jgi:lipid II:glycine glycyltransferase (peptidoglycan interpeptide bridge formation enzyme)
VDLTIPAQVLRNQQRSGHRYDIRRLHSQGFKVVVDDWSLYDLFIQIYRETMRRLDADPYYFFSTDYFQDLRQGLGPRLHLFSVLAPDCSVAAAGLFTETGGIVEYHLSGTADEYRRLAPTKLMLDRAINWAQAAGNRILHLGGGVGSHDDALFQFKTGFSDLRTPFQTWRVICDHMRYAELTEGEGIFNAPIDSFFPAYRTAAELIATK